MMGLDFMVTADYHVWFIEANNFPLWPSNVMELKAMAVSVFKYKIHSCILMLAHYRNSYVMCHGSLCHNIYVCHDMKFYLTKDENNTKF